MHPANDLWLLWLLTGLLWLNLSWLIAYHLRKLTSVASGPARSPGFLNPSRPVPKTIVPTAVRTLSDRSDCVRPIPAATLESSLEPARPQEIH